MMSPYQKQPRHSNTVNSNAFRAIWESCANQFLAIYNSLIPQYERQVDLEVFQKISCDAGVAFNGDRQRVICA